MNIAGVDPGLKGAAVVLRRDGTAAVLRMPVKPDGKSIDGDALAAWLFAQEVDAAVVEKIGARAHQANGKTIRNAGSEFRFAIGVGVIHGCLEALGVPYRLVQPITWKAKILRGLGTDKDAAIKYTQQFLPQVDMTPGKCRVPQDGIADAACLAVYGQKLVKWSKK